MDQNHLNMLLVTPEAIRADAVSHGLSRVVSARVHRARRGACEATPWNEVEETIIHDPRHRHRARVNRHACITAHRNHSKSYQIGARALASLHLTVCVP